MFDTNRLLLIILVTILPFVWIFKLKDFNSKLFFGLFLLAFFTYSGLGGSLKEVDEHYFSYYVIYTFFISIGLYLGRGRNKKYVVRKSTENKLIELIDKYGTTIIIVFFLLKLTSLIYPQFLLHRLIVPPAPDLTSVFAERFETQESSFFESIRYYLLSILSPFFFLSLYKYRFKPWKLVLLLIIIPYIDYCRVGYIGRGDMLQYLFIIIASLYVFLPRMRKLIVISFAVFLPTLIIFMVNYTQIRIGGTASVDNTFEALEHLIFYESNYPLWFSTIYNEPFDINNLITYFKWLITLPIPGFLKGDIGLKGDEIAGLLLGIDSGQRGFYIVLPGLVGESVYYFGKYLFWIHSLLVGLLVGYTFRILNRHHQMGILLFYSVFELTYFINRGGTGSGLPYILKILLVFFIILYFYSRYKIKYDR
ncbi:MAG TPA: oligosaccharide repeat unit polymerase [Gallicola sp.]|nr:oligosaccharide repeat unit polymerase [Gallicola sp.]